MEHKALYRKFRPKTFKEIIGQDHLTQTLKNQILSNHIAHAYLFSGIRGTGKTSTAKIFARALNCLNPNEGDPCNLCENCLSALEDSGMDIIEIDAASNNGVDDIRDLREKIKYPPSKMKYKVYIIDEVHMLSIGAFNALLKTLEEPPSYAIFIFATTEIHKIPATILSRCQKYELKRIQLTDIEKLLADICDASGFAYDLKALSQISSLSEGAARDALSILDQCFAVNTEKHITLDVLTDVLGLVTEEHLFGMIEGLQNQDSKQVLTLLNDIISSGKDIKRFMNQLIEYMRYMMLAKVSNDLGALVSMHEERIALLKSSADVLSLTMIMRSIDVLTQIEMDTKWSSNSRVLLEVGLIKIMQPDLETTLESLTHRIELLESRPVAKEQSIIETQTAMNKVVNSPRKTQILSQTKGAEKDILLDQKEIVSEPIQPEKVYAKPSQNEEHLEDLWEDVLDEVRQTKIGTHALLIDGKFKGVFEGALCVAYGEGYGFHMIAIEKPENRMIVESAIEKIYKQPYPIKYITETTVAKVVDENNHDELYDFLGNHKNKLEVED